MATLQLTAAYETADDGWIVASVIEIPGVYSQGKTMDEARANLADALALMLVGRRDVSGGRTCVSYEPFAFQEPV